MEISMLMMMWGGHYLADYPLQGQYLAEQKAFALETSEGTHALTAHAFIHGLIAGMITSSLTAALIIGISHWLIDFGKASVLLRRGNKTGLYGINVDQALHLSVVVAVWSFVL